MSPPKVLLVDDEPNVLQSLRRLLRREPVTLVTATSPVEALERVQTEPFAVVVSDQRMPEMEGTELLERVQAAAPDTVRLILTGHADMQVALDAINRGAVYRFLSKPWDDEELRQTLSQAVERYQLVEENRRLHQLTEAQNVQLKGWNDTLKRKVFDRTREIVASNQQLEQSLAQAVEVISRMIEMHSEALGNHSQRVAQVAVAMARVLGLDDREVREIQTAALLHDIGKVRLSRAALAKPTHTLSLEEKRQIIEHPQFGESIVEAIPHLRSAARLIRHHHEHIDGTGYPDGLRGEAIPLGARIIAVADAYDNELNARLSHVWNVPHQAVAAVRRRAPGEFDPDLIAVLAEAVLNEEESRGRSWRPSDPSSRQGVLSTQQEVEEGHDPNEIELNIRLLSLGMTISRDLRDTSGRLLLPKDTEVDEVTLERIHHHHSRSPIRGGLFVYRPTPKER